MQRRGKVTLTPEEAFAKVLREIREERGLSQEALGYESNYHRTYIGMLERGLMNPSLRTLLSLASALKIAPGDIIQRVSALVGAGWKQERKQKS
jgi:transcriptional regulator with XRE-family HTH domain